jgi:hypothetical protein
MYRVNQYRSPEPKPPSKTPVVIGAILATLGASALVSAVLLLRVRHTASASAPAASEPLRNPRRGESANAPSRSTAPGAQAGHAPSAAPMEDEMEPVPAAPGTPRSSERARPAWAKDASYAPQLGDALDVFVAAAPMRGDVARGLIVCRVQSFNKMDTFAGDDLRVSVVFPDTPGRTANGPEDANLAFVSAPLAQLTHGDTVRFEVWDRDVFDDELITRTSTKYDAGPLLLADTGASIECRVLEGAALDRQAKLHGERADKTARALAAHKLDGRRPMWGWPAGDVGGAQSAASDVAALVGWDDPRTKKRIDGLAVAVASLEAQRGRLFGELRAAAKPDADVRGLHAHLEELACGPRKAAVGAHAATSPCVARVSLRNDSADVVAFTSYGGPQAYVATAASGPVAARFENLPKTELAPAETLEVLVVPEGIAIDAEPALIGLCVGSTCDVLLAR